VTAIFDDPRTLVSLSRVAALVSEFFDLDDPVEYDTPFVWWDRSKKNFGIALPMPEPIAFVGASAKGEASWSRGPLWHQEQIVHWYAEWRDLEVPFCREAGDRVTNRGATVPSSYRVA